MAAPFTAKHSSVAPCLDVLRQGRTTLVTTVQMFKILGLLCLATAYSLSVLYIDGIKLGDLQVRMQWDVGGRKGLRGAEGREGTLLACSTPTASSWWACRWATRYAGPSAAAEQGRAGQGRPRLSRRGPA